MFKKIILLTTLIVCQSFSLHASVPKPSQGASVSSATMPQLEKGMQDFMSSQGWKALAVNSEKSFVLHMPNAQPGHIKLYRVFIKKLPGNKVQGRLERQLQTIKGTPYGLVLYKENPQDSGLKIYKGLVIKNANYLAMPMGQTFFDSSLDVNLPNKNMHLRIYVTKMAKGIDPKVEVAKIIFSPNGLKNPEKVEVIETTVLNP